MSKEQEIRKEIKQIVDEMSVEEIKDRIKIDKQEKAIETVLSMLKEKDKEVEELKADNKKAWKLNANMSKRHLTDIFKIKKKDKQIDLMAKYLAINGVERDICNKQRIKENCKNVTVDNLIVHRCKKCIKRYFERKATNNG